MAVEKIPSDPGSSPADENLPLPSDMQEKHGPILRWLFRIFFRKVNFREEDRERIKKLAGQGTVIYVMRSRSFVAYLYFNYAFLTFGLPLARFVNGIHALLFMSFQKWRQYRKQRIHGVTGTVFEEETRLRHLTRHGESSLLFLQQSAVLSAEGKDYPAEFMRVLVEVQRKYPRPLYLIPQVLIYEKSPSSARRTIWDILLGPRDNPGRLRDFLTFLFFHRQARVVVGEEIDLQKFVAGHAETESVILAKKLRLVCLHYLRREQEVVFGPRKLPIAHTRDLVLREAAVKEAVAKESARLGQPPAAVWERARQIIKEIAANMDLYTLDFFDWLISQVWNVIGLTIHYDRDEIERLRALARKNTLILNPAHRSHLDYLLISQIFWRCDLAPPHIAAGENLAFWPIGNLFRSSGAFFMRRRFRGDPLYSSIFRAYLRRLVKEGHSLEFFIEGTRSRSGKMLPPKLGILSMVLDAWQSGVAQELCFVPIHVGYDKLMESRAYAAELAGKKKSRETLGALIRSASLLRYRYGSVYVRFGEAINLKEFFARRGQDPAKLDAAEMRKAVRALGYRIVVDINKAGIVYPSFLLAAILLEQHHGEASYDDIIQRAALLLKLLPPAAQVSPRLAEELEPRLKEVLDLFSRDGTLTEKDGVYRVTEKGRLTLAYHRNTCIHFYLERAIAATTLLSYGGETIPLPALRERALELGLLLKYEFAYSADLPLANILEDNLRFALAHKYLELDGEMVRPCAEPQRELWLLRSLLQPFLTAYILATRTIADIDFKSLFRADFVRRAAERGRQLIEDGGALLPEACSRIALDNAVAVLIDRGFIEEDEGAEGDPKGGLLVPKDKGRSPRSRQEFIDHLNLFLGAKDEQLTRITQTGQLITAGAIAKTPTSG